MQISNLQDLYVEQLRDLYSAESQLVKALPKMAKAASHPELKQSFEMHLEQTKHQREAVKQIIADLGEKATGHTCKAMEGLIAEGEELIARKAKIDPKAFDAGLIAAAQRVEHYEIAGYGTLKAYAKQLGAEDALAVLNQISQEEGETDHKLTQLALKVINPAAV